MHDRASDEKWKQYIEGITDPIEMLRAIVENQEFLGYDGYYADLREALLSQAEKIIETPAYPQLSIRHSFCTYSGEL